MSFLPGHFPCGAADVALTTLFLIASNTSTASTITGPAAIQEGDLLVLLDRGRGGGLPATAVPSGFNSIFNNTGPNNDVHRTIASYKIADGSEAGATLTGINAASVNRKVLLVFRGNSPIKSVAALDADSQGTDGNPNAQTVTSSSGTPPLIVFGAYGVDAAGTIDPRTFTVGGSPAKDGEVNSTTNLYLAWKIYNYQSTPADVVVDQDDEGNINCLGSFYITCA